MTHQFLIMKPGDVFIAHNSGVQIAREARCEHGQPAVFLALLGGYRSRAGQPEQRFHALVPRCVLAEAVGALQAQMVRDEGEAAWQEFLGDIARYAAESTAALEQLHAEHRDCCEAGFTTHGREHTCGRNGDGE